MAREQLQQAAPAKFIQLHTFHDVLHALDANGRVWWLDSDESVWVAETEERSEGEEEGDDT
jgi:hypothetical protein